MHQSQHNVSEAFPLDHCLGDSIMTYERLELGLRWIHDFKLRIGIMNVRKNGTKGTSHDQITCLTITIFHSLICISYYTKDFNHWLLV